MPSLMDSAVLLSPSPMLPEQQLLSGCLQDGSMQAPAFAPRAAEGGSAEPLPASRAASGSGILCSAVSGDWHILSAAEISTALPVQNSAPSADGSSDSDMSAVDALPPPLPPLPVSPAKSKPKSRRGNPKPTPKSSSSPAKRALAATDAEEPAACDNGSGETATRAAAKPAAPGRAGASLAARNMTAVACGKPLRVWNPFAGLKLMGSRQRAARSRILDLAPLPAATAPTTEVIGPAAGTVAAFVAGDDSKAASPRLAGAAEHADPAPAIRAPGGGIGGSRMMCDSVPDIDAVTDGGTLAGTEAAVADAAALDYDTAQEGPGAAAGKKAAAATKSKLSEASASCSGGASAINLTASIPAAAADYKLLGKAAGKPTSAKQRKKKGRKLR